MLKNILLATDFSPASRAALRVALNLCEDALSTLHVVHVLPKMDGRVYKVMSQLAEKDMEAFFPSGLYPNNRKEILYCDSASEAVRQYAKDHACDLIVLGAKSGTSLGDLIGRSMIRRLEHDTTYPLMLVPDTERIDTQQHHFSKILAAVHCSKLSKKAFVFALRSAKILSADLHVACVIDSHEIANSEGLESRRKATHARITKLVSTEAMKLNFPNSRLFVQIRSGNTSEEITKYVAQNGIDLIVIGAHPAKGILDILTPNLASSVLSKTETPEIVISDGSFGKNPH